MYKKLTLAASLLLAFAGAAQAQSCTCNAAAARTASTAALTALLNDKMACANVGAEVWQEHHNPNGELWDYKLGSDPRDKSSKVGTYTINPDNTVTYIYDVGGRYTYDVCFVTTSTSYTFCGAQYGGRNITGARIGGAGLTPCSGVTTTAPNLGVTRTR